MDHRPIPPKSTAHLRRGDFWALPLADGSFGAGCVVGDCIRGSKKHTRLFIAGVVAWQGQEPPNVTDVKDRPVIAHAFAHIKTITSSGGCIIGRGQIYFGDLPNSAVSLSLPTWGYGMPTILADRFAKNGS